MECCVQCAVPKFVGLQRASVGDQKDMATQRVAVDAEWIKKNVTQSAEIVIELIEQKDEHRMRYHQTCMANPIRTFQEIGKPVAEHSILYHS